MVLFIYLSGAEYDAFHRIIGYELRTIFPRCHIVPTLPILKNNTLKESADGHVLQGGCTGLNTM